MDIKNKQHLANLLKDLGGTNETDINLPQPDGSKNSNGETHIFAKSWNDEFYELRKNDPKNTISLSIPKVDIYTYNFELDNKPVRIGGITYDAKEPEGVALLEGHCTRQSDVVRSWLGNTMLSEYPNHVILDFAKIVGLTYKYKAIEDNNSKLYLFLRDPFDQLIYARGGYESTRGLLSEHIEALKSDTDFSAWKGEDGPDLPRNIRARGEIRTVADEKGLYPYHMGYMSMLEFGFDPSEFGLDAEDVTKPRFYHESVGECANDVYEIEADDWDSARRIALSTMKSGDNLVWCLPVAIKTDRFGFNYIDKDKCVEYDVLHICAQGELDIYPEIEFDDEDEENEFLSKLVYWWNSDPETNYDSDGNAI